MPLSIAHPSINLAAEPESALKPEAEPEQQGQGANSIYTGKIVVHNVMSEESIWFNSYMKPDYFELISILGCTGSNPSKGCFGFPSDCVSVKNQNCDMMTTYAFDKETSKLNVELFKK